MEKKTKGRNRNILFLKGEKYREGAEKEKKKIILGHSIETVKNTETESWENRGRERKLRILCRSFCFSVCRTNSWE
jgi:hypothetical protein